MDDDYCSLYWEAINRALIGTLIQFAGGAPVSLHLSFEKLCTWTKEARDAENAIYFVGNGASAAMASHYAVDFTKNTRCRSLCFNDAAFLTAIGNDLGFDNVFSVPLRAFLRKGDLLVTISSSGNSPNILAAASTAKDLGATIVTFSGMNPENALRKSGNLNFYVPARTYGIVESVHHILLHCWLDKFLGVEEWKVGKCG